jgi:hypothetical protein
MINGEPANFHPVPVGKRFHLESNTIVLNSRYFHGGAIGAAL